MVYTRKNFEWDIGSGMTEYPLSVNILLRLELEGTEESKRRFQEFLSRYGEARTYPQSSVAALLIADKEHLDGFVAALFDPTNRTFLESIVTLTGGEYRTHADAAERSRM